MNIIINEENDGNHVEGDAVEGSVDCVCREEVVRAINAMKT